MSLGELRSIKIRSKKRGDFPIPDSRSAGNRESGIGPFPDSAGNRESGSRFGEPGISWSGAPTLLLPLAARKPPAVTAGGPRGAGRSNLAQAWAWDFVDLLREGLVAATKGNCRPSLASSHRPGPRTSWAFYDADSESEAPGRLMRPECRGCEGGGSPRWHPDPAPKSGDREGPGRNRDPRPVAETPTVTDAATKAGTETRPHCTGHRRRAGSVLSDRDFPSSSLAAACAAPFK